MAAPSIAVRRFVVIVIYLLGVGWGVHSALGSEQSSAPFVISLGLAIACAVWCVADAQAHGRTLVWPARIAVFFFWPVGVPVYLIWSRGKQGLLTAILAGAAWVAIAFAAFMMAGYAAYGSAWFG